MRAALFVCLWLAAIVAVACAGSDGTCPTTGPTFYTACNSEGLVCTTQKADFEVSQWVCTNGHFQFAGNYCTGCGDAGECEAGPVDGGRECGPVECKNDCNGGFISTGDPCCAEGMVCGVGDWPDTGSGCGQCSPSLRCEGGRFVDNHPTTCGLPCDAGPLDTGIDAPDAPTDAMTSDVVNDAVSDVASQ